MPLLQQVMCQRHGAPLEAPGTKHQTPWHRHSRLQLTCNNARAAPLKEGVLIDGGIMKLALALAVLVAPLGGCVVVPARYPGPGYAAPAVVVPASVVVVRPWYYRRWGY